MMLGQAKKYNLMSGKIESYTNAKLTKKYTWHKNILNSPLLKLI